MPVSARSLIVLLIFGVASVLNISLAEPLRLYSCPKASTVAEALLCPIGCNDDSSSSGYMEFKVDTSSKSVMQMSKLSSPMEINGKKFPRGYTITSQIFENCKIFDKKNWDCSENSEPVDDPSMGIFLSHGVYRRMTDGVYKSYLWTETSTGQYHNRKKSIATSSCMIPFS